jgi:cell wall-associated NlpC family hydrolase
VKTACGKANEPPWLSRVWAQAGASGRIGILILCALFFALVADSRPVLAYATVTPASGGTRLVAGTPASVSGPYVAEAVPGDIGAGDITLQAPPGFKFDTSQHVTATVTTKGNCRPGGLTKDASVAAQDQYVPPSPSSANPIENRPLLLDGGVSQTVEPTPGRITVEVAQPSSGDCTASIEWSGISIIATAEGSGSLTKAPGGSVISGVADGDTDFGWLSATAPPQQEKTVAPRGAEPAAPASASAEPTAPASASAEPEEEQPEEQPEERSGAPRVTPEEGTTLAPEPEKTDEAETPDLGETTDGSTDGSIVEEGLSGAKRLISGGFTQLFSAVVSEDPESDDQHDSESQHDSDSEGTAAEARAPEEALSVMEPTTDYSQVVDNASPGRFSAPGWERTSEDVPFYDQDYSYVESSRGASSARFKMKIPASDHYTVYAWWPAAEGNSAATRFGISTTSGVEWTEVNQQTDGGMWVRLGAYRMEEGDTYAVEVSPDSLGGGRVVADAVMVVRGTQVAPEDAAGEEATASDRMSAAGKEDAASEEDAAGDRMSAAGKKKAAAGGRPAKGDVVRVARRYIGTKYSFATCTKKVMSCTCLTKTVFSKFGHKLPMSEDGQWTYNRGRKVAKSGLRPGDIVFFKEKGRNKPISHVGIYSGNGNVIHASSYWGKVVERPMKYVDGYYGAKRLKLR